MTKPEVSGHCGQDLEFPSYSSSPLTFLPPVSPDTSWTDTCLGNVVSCCYSSTTFVPCPVSAALRYGLCWGLACQGRHTTVAPSPRFPLLGLQNNTKIFWDRGYIVLFHL